MDALIRIQQKLKVPKNQFNTFGNYKYRSCEDILEAVKPLLGEATLVLSDEVVEIGSRVYIKATAILRQGDTAVSVTAWAREQDSRKGMDAAQVTGSASSYARKYALSGLFLCADAQGDPDVPGSEPPPTGPAPWDNKPKGQPPAATPPAEPPPAAPQGEIPAPTPDQRQWLKLLWDYYVAQSGGRLQAVDAKPMQKMLTLCYMNFNRFPGSMSDVEQLKKWINVEQLCV